MLLALLGLSIVVLLSHHAMLARWNTSRHVSAFSARKIIRAPYKIPDFVESDGIGRWGRSQFESIWEVYSLVNDSCTASDEVWDPLLRRCTGFPAELRSVTRGGFGSFWNWDIGTSDHPSVDRPDAGPALQLNLRRRDTAGFLHRCGTSTSAGDSCKRGALKIGTSAGCR